MASILKVNEIQHTGGTSALTVDSSGRILQPTKPAFAVRNARSSSYRGDNLFGGSDTTVIFDIGNDFASSGTNDGGFVAPITGVYCFSIMGFTSNSAQNNAAGGFYVQLSKNGSQVGHKIYGYAQSADYNRFDNTQMLQLTAGDVIKVDVPTSGNYVWGGGGDLSRAAQFQGHLVG
ncbi:MAG: hypothetical protein CBD35_03910 [Verrucomicrobia bacterium TMED175]|nr:MAG: hypothetical protein CBD35_03910 [Verrucomicrobia bacterium TMED175]|tara:strand:- start:40 stop:567 length:528 start_codon:yes stop_codon:yes gene_type:complete